VIWDTLNPKFTTSIELDYYFELEKILVFRVYDANKEHGREVKGDFLGESECTLGSIVGNRGKWLKKELLDQKKKLCMGNLFIRAEEIDQGNFDVMTIQFEGNSLVYKGFLCCMVFKPMFHVCRMMEGDDHQIVYASEVLRGNNPRWRPIVQNVRQLTAGDFGRPLLFQLYDHTHSGKHKMIGSFQFTLSEIKENDRKGFRVISEDRVDMGEIRLVKVEVTKEPSFLDYIYGGCSINLVIGIDFTSSNGHPSGPSSLHYINKQSLNQYQTALKSVGQILLDYDTDKQVPVYGFGALVDKVVSHCFPLNFNEDDPAVTGLDGILNVYKEFISKIKLAGPTNFSPIINRAVEMAKEARVNQENQEYYILLMLTDGMISDMRDTIDTIVRGSSFPLSLIIVGVGNANFENMEELDGDLKPLEDIQGRNCERDIVQFVPFNEYKDDPVALTREVLAEIPREILNFFKLRNIKPNPKIEGAEEGFPNIEVSINDVQPIIAQI
jgi:vacuolar-type H+-ATPase subunit F/Vma7